MMEQKQLKQLLDKACKKPVSQCSVPELYQGLLALVQAMAEKRGKTARTEK